VELLWEEAMTNETILVISAILSPCMAINYWLERKELKARQREAILAAAGFLYSFDRCANRKAQERIIAAFDAGS
jgi:hypothetical protein